MRIIGHVDTEKQAFTFYSYLLSLGIHSTYEPQRDEEQKKTVMALWIYEEDQLDKAKELLAEYKANPFSPEYTKVEFPVVPPQSPDKIAEEREQVAAAQAKKWNKNQQAAPRKKRPYPLTYFVILVCTILYFLTGAEQFQMIKNDGKVALQIGMTPVQQKLMFDYPRSNERIDQLLEQYNLKTYDDLKALPPSEAIQFKEAEEIPTWRGATDLLMNKIKGKPTVDAPLFEKIRQGEVWRLITPVFLHGGFLHILFNMAWVWLLLRQVEDRLPKGKILLLMLLMGLISNLVQYLVSGPYFLGFSGIVCGLVGFIWMRQKIAPWEGYPLDRTTIIFILVFVGAMFALEIFSLLSAALFAKQMSANIANTAHIVGGLAGILLGRVPFFSRGHK